jgi:hypothetical protein
MSQFDSELDANEIRAKFDALSESPIGVKLLIKIGSVVRHILNPDPKSQLNLGEAVSELILAFQDDNATRRVQESEFLIKSVVLAVRRHDRTIDIMQDRLTSIETRLEEGLRVALRMPTDGSKATL